MFLVNIYQGIPLSIWYCIYNGPEPEKYSEAGYGLIRWDSTKKPSYFAAQTICQKLAGYSYTERLNVGNGDDYVLKLRKGQDEALAMWTVGGTHNVTVPIAEAMGTLVTMLGNESPISWGSSGLTTSISQSPQYVLYRGPTIAEAKGMANGILCTIRDPLVTATPSVSQFYVESDDRCAGMAVYKSSHGLSPGVRVDIIGTTSTNSGGEKYINATTVAAVGPGGETIEPLVLSLRAVGGADWCYDASTRAGQKGVRDYRPVKSGDSWILAFTDAVGLNNIGLLITTFGKVTYSTSGYFYLDDGSKLKDNSTCTGVKVLGTVPPPQPTPPGWTALGKYVIVTGISSCFKAASPSTDLYRQIRATEVVIVN